MTCNVACMCICLYVCGVPCTVDAVDDGKMSTWLFDGWIGTNRPKSTGRGECVTCTDRVGIAMGRADELDTEGKESGTAVDATVDLFGSCEFRVWRESSCQCPLFACLYIIVCGIVGSFLCVSFEYHTTC